MNNYKITAYCKEKDITFVIETYGMYEKLWQFSAFLVSKGLKIIDVGQIAQSKRYSKNKFYIREIN